MAEDIVQDIILELYSRRLRFNTPVALKSFLFLSVKNRALNFLRRQRAQEHYLSISVEEESFFLNNIIREEVYYHLQKMIGELSDPVRKIYELTLQEFSNEEIAEQLGLTVDSVKAHKKRGKQILKERFNGLLPGKIPATALYAEKYKFEIIPQYRHGPFEMSLHCSFCNIHLCCNFFDLFLLDNMK